MPHTPLSHTHQLRHEQNQTFIINDFLCANECSHINASAAKQIIQAPFSLAAVAVTSTVKETSSPETKSKLMKIPQQECSPQKIDRKPDAHIPSQVESDDDPKAIGGLSKLQTEQDLPVTNQMSDLDIDSKLPRQEEGNDSIPPNDDDVFDSTGNIMETDSDIEI